MPIVEFVLPVTQVRPRLLAAPGAARESGPTIGTLFAQPGRK